MIPVKQKSKGLLVPKPLFFGVIIAGLGTILLIGLLTGLVARPNNCIKTTTVSVPSTSPTISSSSSSQSTSGTTTASQTTSSSSTSTSTTARSSSSSTSSATSTMTDQPTSSSTRTTTSISSTSVSTNTTEGSSITPVRTLPTLPTSKDVTTTPAFSTDFRLPQILVVNKYDLLLKFYFDPYDIGNDIFANTDYQGEVTMTIELFSETNSIVFHSDRTLIYGRLDVTLTDSNNQAILIKALNRLSNQLREITVDNVLPLGIYTIKITYSNVVKTQVTYFTEKGVQKGIVANKFVPVGAREAFPCFDEPSFKAVFEITIEHPDKTVALSNYDVQNSGTFQESNITRKRTKFLPTAKLSTHKVSWTVFPDDFKAEESLSKVANTKVRVFAKKSASSNGEAKFALEVAQKTIEYFNDYFQIPDAVPSKIDLIGIPRYTGIASSNIGLNQFHEENLLYSEQLNTLSDKEQVALLIAIDMAHYWVGNYANFAWWDDAWITEGLSLFLAYRALENIYPDWQIENQIIDRHLIPIMWEDSFPTSRPLRIEINNPNELLRAYDSLTFSKGAAIFRMLESVATPASFKEDIIKLIRQSGPFGLITVNDLYAEIRLPRSLGVTTKDYLERWILQKNFPEVAVKLEGAPSEVTFVPKRFLLDEERTGAFDTGNSTFGYKWLIHLQCRAGGTYNPNLGDLQHITGDVYDFEYFLTSDSGTMKLDRRYTWVKCNRNFNGYYISDYNLEINQALEKVLVLKPELLTVADRANLIHVAFELSYSAFTDYDIPAVLSEYLSNEASLVPWNAFMWHLNELATFDEHRFSFRTLRSYAIELIRRFQESNDIWNDSGNHQTRLLKKSMIEFLCRIQEEECLRKSTELFNTIPTEYFNSPTDSRYVNPVPANHRPFVYKFHLQNTYDYFDWFKLIDFYTATANPSERIHALEALAATRQTWLIDILLADTLDLENTPLDVDDIIKLLSYIGKNPSGRHLSWDFIRQTWLLFEIIYPNKEAQIFQVVRDISKTFDNDYQYDELTKFFRGAVAVGTYEQQVQVLANVITNIFWIDNKEADFVKNFNLNSSLATTRITTERTTVTQRTLPTNPTQPQSTSTSPAPPAEFRIPTKIRPEFYKLFVNYDFDAILNEDDPTFEYNGNVEITFELQEPTDTVVFHAAGILDIKKSTASFSRLSDEDDEQSIQIRDINAMSFERYAIKFDNQLAVGSYVLKMNFEGSLGFRSTYVTDYSELGSKRVLVATRFIPTGARTHFPCFDEPGLKAPFEITIQHPIDTIALSNALENSNTTFEENGKQRKRTHFKATDQINPHTVAWTILPDNFEHKTVQIGQFKQLRVFARRSAINAGEADFALSTAKSLLEFYIDYFGISQAEPEKIDLVAVPNFRGIATSTAGLNLFHEENILFSDKVESIENLEKVAMTLAIDIANYWLANYVSAAWWDDYWLTEGIATFVSYKAVNSIFNERNTENLFITNELIEGMWEDAFRSTKPLKHRIDRPEDILTIFDPLTYTKGCALFRMLENMFSINFQANIKEFLLSGVSSGVVTVENLYEKFPFPQDYPTSIKDFIERWTLQKNFPVIGVYFDSNKVEFIQSRFIVEDALVDPNESPFGYVWHVNVECKAGGTYDESLGDTQHITGEVIEFKTLITEEYSEYLLDRNYTWIKCNKDFKGYYLPNYEEYVYDNLVIVLKQSPELLSPADRANLIHVGFETAFVGLNDYNVPAKLLSYISDIEKDYVPWKTFIWHMEKISTISEHRISFRNLRGFNIDRVRQIGDSFDIWDDQGTDEDRLLKMSLIEFLCRMQDLYCINKTTEMYNTIDKRYFASPLDPLFINPIKPNHRAIVYKYHMQNTYNYLDWLLMFDLYDATTNVQESLDALSALANTRQPWLFDKLLYETAIFSDVNLRLEDVPETYTFIGKNPTGRYFSWAYIRFSWIFYQLFDRGLLKDLNIAVGQISSSFDNDLLLKELVDFYATTPELDYGQLRMRIVENVRNNIRWARQREQDLIQNFIGIDRSSY